MAENWTPGPWGIVTAENLRGDLYWSVGIPGISEPIDLRSDERGEANAHLIAAAPELYAALKNLVPRFESACRRAGSDEEFAREATATARAALAKARGEQP
jgi:hypothetical protein